MIDIYIGLTKEDGSVIFVTYTDIYDYIYNTASGVYD